MTFKIPKALATPMLPTIGSKQVANIQTMENNRTKVASIFYRKCKNLKDGRNLYKNEFEVVTSLNRHWGKTEKISCKIDSRFTSIKSRLS